MTKRWRWVAWPAGIGILGYLLIAALSSDPLPEFGIEGHSLFRLDGAAEFLEGLAYGAAVLLIVGIIGALISLIVRFRRSRGVERKQLNWLTYASGIIIVAFLVSSSIWVLFPGSAVVFEITILVSNIVMLAIPIATGIAILRYRLYDIDVIVNRTLVYGALTTLVVVLYILVVGSMSLVFQSSNNLIISLVATGFVAALFNPLRRRVQMGIDRRFYRSRLDAQKSLAGFNIAIRNEVDPDRLSIVLLDVVDEAFKPDEVSLWLVPRREGKRN
jgi:hypothetical protein